MLPIERRKVGLVGAIYRRTVLLAPAAIVARSLVTLIRDIHPTLVAR